MSKLTLSDYQSKPISDFFMAVISQPLSQAEAKEYLASLSHDDSIYSILNTFLQNIFQKLGTSADNPALKNALNELISVGLERSAAIIVLKVGDTYINVNDDEEIDMNSYQLTNLEPFSDYYSVGEYRFIEVNGRVVLDVNSMAPFNKYEEKVKS